MQATKVEEVVAADLTRKHLDGAGEPNRVKQRHLGKGEGGCMKHRREYVRYKKRDACCIPGLFGGLCLLVEMLQVTCCTQSRYHRGCCCCWWCCLRCVYTQAVLLLRSGSHQGEGQRTSSKQSPNTVRLSYPSCVTRRSSSSSFWCALTPMTNSLMVSSLSCGKDESWARILIWQLHKLARVWISKGQAGNLASSCAGAAVPHSDMSHVAVSH